MYTKYLSLFRIAVYSNRRLYADYIQYFISTYSSRNHSLNIMCNFFPNMPPHFCKKRKEKLSRRYLYIYTYTDTCGVIAHKLKICTRNIIGEGWSIGLNKIREFKILIGTVGCCIETKVFFIVKNHSKLVNLYFFFFFRTFYLGVSI